MAIIKPEQLSSGLYSISGSFSGSFHGDGSDLTNLPTQSFETGSFVLTSSFNAFTSSYNTGSFTGSFTGSLLGTASYAQTASFATNTISASYALTSSYLTSLEQQIILSGSLKLDPTQDPDPTGIDLDSTVLFQSSSNTALGYDLYIRQNGNLVKWKWIEGILETGLLYGGVVTYSGSNVFVSPGSGIIAEHNATTGSEISPMIEYVTWNAITQSIANIATQQVTYLYIDNTGALQQQSTRFTSQQYHDYIPLGAVGHFDYTQVSAFGGGVQTAYDQISQISNFVDAFGPLKISGYGLTGQAGSLRLSVGSGTSFIHGGFYQNDPEFPSQITTPSQSTASLARVQRSGSAIEFDTNAGNLYTVVDPTRYDRDGDGTLASVGSGNWTIQRVFIDPKTGVLYVYYGQARYTSLLNALQYLPTDPFTEGDTFDFTTFVGFLVLKGNASDITDTANNSIINGGLFRGSGQGSGGGIALSNLDDLTDVSITSPTNGEALIYDSGIWQNGVPLNATSASFASAVPASGVIGLNLSQIATGSVTASVSPTQFTVTSGSVTEFVVRGTGVTIGNAITDTHQITGSALITGSLGVTGSLLTHAQGSSASDIAFRVRNSADTITNFSIDGLGYINSVLNNSFYTRTFIIGGGNTNNKAAAGGYEDGVILGFNNIFGSVDTLIIGNNNNEGNTTLGNNILIGFNNNQKQGISLGNSNTGTGYVLGNSNALSAVNGFAQNSFILGNNISVSNNSSNNNTIFFGSRTSSGNAYASMHENNFGIGGIIPTLTNYDLNARGVFYTQTGTAPTTLAADTFAFYSADRNGATGKASPHFRTEDGTVVWLGDESRLFNVTASRTIISSSQNTVSGSSLTVYGSGSAQPVFTIQGSQGELFSITDSLSGSLFSVNDISGLPILEVFSDNTTLIGDYQDPMLITTKKVVMTNSGSFTVYGLPTASYDTAFYDYSIRSGSNARAGQIMAIQSGSSVNFTETTTTDFGDTTAVAFAVIISGSNMILTGSAATGSWTTKCIIRGL